MSQSLQSYSKLLAAQGHQLKSHPFNLSQPKVLNSSLPLKDLSKNYLMEFKKSCCPFIKGLGITLKTIKLWAATLS